MPPRVRLFQFQTGAIKSPDLEGNAFPEMRFNSKLVRLKAPTLAACWVRCSGFNSKLVRLKVFNNVITVMTLGHVSIPNWCD